MLVDKEFFTSINEKIDPRKIKDIFDELGSMLLKRLECAELEIDKAYNREGWVNDDAFLQAMAEKRLVEDVIHTISIVGKSKPFYNGEMPNKLSHPVYKDEITNALNMLAFLKLGLDKMEITTKAMDGDNMRNFNKENGYEMGDKVLQKTAKDHCDQNMVIFRLYGDSFCAYDRELLQEKLGIEWDVDWRI